MNTVFRNFRRMGWGCLMVFSGAVMAQELPIVAQKIQAELVEVQKSPTQLRGASVLQLPGYFVWGGSVVQGDEGRYHMLFSLWESGPGTAPFSTSWVLESKIGYAVSEYPDRDFEFKGIVLKGARYNGNEEAWDAQGVHNPHIKKFNGKYYLYYIGGRDPGVQPKGSSGEGLDKRNRVQQSQCLGMISFSNFEDLLSGNFDRPAKPLLSPRTRVKKKPVVDQSPAGTVAKPDNLIVVNPSVTHNPKTGQYFLYFKGNVYDPHWKGIHGMAVADRPEGPFTPLDRVVFDIKMPDGSLASTEDPYVWYAPKWDRFMAVVKDFPGRITGAGKGTLALLTSTDGKVWHPAKHPLFMKRELLLSDGTRIPVDRLERPQLLVGSEGVPKVMYAACSLEKVNAKNDGSSFNVQIPLANPLQ